MNTNLSGFSETDGGAEKPKKVLLLCLAISCAFLLLILWLMPVAERPAIESTEVIDDVVAETLAGWGLGSGAIAYEEFAADSLFSRREASVMVHPSIPTTLIHARIARRLSPLGIDIIGERHFPENTLELQFIAYNTLVYSLFFMTSTEQNDGEEPLGPPGIVPIQE